VALPVSGSCIPGKTNWLAPRSIIEIAKTSTPGGPIVIRVAWLLVMRDKPSAPILAKENSVR
jgi:nitrogen fixation protein